jgi:hypothetical protein
MGINQEDPISRLGRKGSDTMPSGCDELNFSGGGY